MNPEVRQELNALASGKGVERAAFLALLGDPEAREDLRRLAQLRLILDGAPEPDRPDAVMDVTWEELARHAEGTLADEGRRLAAERFLNRHFPEGLKHLAAGGDRGTSASPAETVAQPPRPADDPAAGP